MNAHNSSRRPRLSSRLMKFVLVLTLLSCDEAGTVSTDAYPLVSSGSEAVTASDVAEPTTIATAGDVTAEDEDVATEDEDVIFSSDSAPPVVSVTWDNGDTDKRARTADALYLKVKNHEKLAAEVSIHIDFAGILEEAASAELGPFLVEPQGEISLALPAEKVPMQTMVGVCQAFASVKAVYTEGKNQYIARSGSNALFYRQQNDYKTMKLFGKEIFESEYKGRFTDLSTEIEKLGLENAKETILGRINRNGKGFENVSLSSSLVASKNGDMSPSIIVGTGFGTVGSYEDEEKEMGHEK